MIFAWKEAREGVRVSSKREAGSSKKGLRGIKPGIIRNQYGLPRRRLERYKLLVDRQPPTNGSIEENGIYYLHSSRPGGNLGEKSETRRSAEEIGQRGILSKITEGWRGREKITSPCRK